MASAIYPVDDLNLFVKKALHWASLFKYACCFHSGQYQLDPYSKFDILIAAGNGTAFYGENGTGFTSLQHFLTKHSNQWIPGFLSYELKEELEDLRSPHENKLGFPNAFFFVPEHVLLIKDGQLKLITGQPDRIFQEISSFSYTDQAFQFQGNLKSSMTKADYTQVFDQLLRHIHRGDIYEVNLCQEFYAENCVFMPLEAFWKLNALSPNPFSLLFKQEDHFIVSASPERFLAKRGQTLISQPIKGTAPRGKDQQEDQERIQALLASQKEISENVMIVDLVRNDLTRSAKPATVEVKELTGLYSFQYVHQLISTIICQEKENMPVVESIKNTFPAGSMTGAPKVSAMRLIDRYEKSRRGIYAGSAGYFAPDGDYDFNVIIRSLLYNAEQKRLSFHVGGAVTAEAQAEREYEECLWKAKAMMDLLGTQITS